MLVKKTVKVVLDSNFVLVPVQFKLDIFEVIKNLFEEPVEFFVTDNVLREVKKIAEGKGKHGAAAKAGLKLLNINDVKVLKVGVNESVDKTLVELGKQGYIIATNDKELRRKLKKVGAKTIYLRGRKYLEVG